MKALIIFLAIFNLVLYLRLLKRSLFGLSQSNFSGLFIFIVLFVYITPGVLIVTFTPIENLWVAFKVNSNIIPMVSLLILFSITIIILLMKMVFKYNIICFPAKTYFLKQYNIRNIERVIKIFFVSAFLGLFLVSFIYGANHSFVEVMRGVNLSLARSSLKSFGFITQMFIHFTTTIPMLMIPMILIADKNKVRQVIYSILLLILVSYSGGKAPIMNFLIIYIFSYALIFRIRILNQIPILFVSFSGILLLLYQIVLFQYPQFSNLDLFLDYFLQRTFVAGIIGVYEQMSLLIINPSYILNSIPFYSSIFEVPNFHKDLMMITEDRIDPSTIGIKNTFFIAESFAFFGFIGLVLGPILYVFNYYLGLKLISKLLSKIFSINFTDAILIFSLPYFGVIKFNGGFSDILFLKTPILIIMIMLQNH